MHTVTLLIEVLNVDGHINKTICIRLTDKTMEIFFVQ